MGATNMQHMPFRYKLWHAVVVSPLHELKCVFKASLKGIRSILLVFRRKQLTNGRYFKKRVF